MKRALAFLTLLIAIGAGSCCHTVRHQYVIDAPDPDLQQTLQACVQKLSCYMNGKECIWPECETACRRVVTLAGDSADGDLVHCYVTPGLDGGTAVRVSAEFDPCGIL
jgi:hypothetical protein